MSKYCMKCGAKLADDDLFCGSCGAKQEAAEAPAEVPAEASAESKNETEEIITAPSPEPDSFATAAGKPKRGRKPFILAVCGIAVICVIAVLAVFFLGTNDEKTYEEYVSEYESLIASAKENYCCVEERRTEGNNIFTTTYSYDKDCNVVYKSKREASKDDPDNTISMYEWLYLYNDGKLVQCSEEYTMFIKDSVGDSIGFQNITTYEYDSSDRRIAEYRNGTDVNGKATNGYNTYGYADDGSGNYWFNDGDLGTYYYNKDDIITEQVLYFENSDIKKIRISYYYFDNGDIESEIACFENSDGTSDTYSTQYSYEWDIVSGNRIAFDTHTKSDLNGKTVYEYDRHGNCIKETRYNAGNEVEYFTEYVYKEKSMFVNVSESNAIEDNDAVCSFLDEKSGIWVDMGTVTLDSTLGASFTFCVIEDGKLYFGWYPGEFSRSGMISDVRNLDERTYSVTLHYQEEDWYEDHYEASDETYTLIFDGQTFAFSDNPETIYTYMGSDLDNAISALEAAIEGKAQSQKMGKKYETSIISGNHTYTGTMNVDGLSCCLKLDKPISYQEDPDSEPITDTDLWLSEADASFFSGYNGLTVTLEGRLFNYRGSGSLMFDGTPTVISVSGTPEVPVPSSKYQNWESTDNETIFWDALEILRTVIYRCNGVWDVRTLSGTDGVEEFSEPVAIMLSINDNWIEKYGYCAYVAPEEDGVVIEFDAAGYSVAVWKYGWDGSLISGDGTLEEFVLSNGLV